MGGKRHNTDYRKNLKHACLTTCLECVSHRNLECLDYPTLTKEEADTIWETIRFLGKIKDRPHFPKRHLPKQKNPQSPWKEPTERKVQIDMGQFGREWVQNYEGWEKLLKETVARLDAGEKVTSDEMCNLFESTSENGTEEIGKALTNTKQTPEERKRALLLGGTLNLPRGWRTAPALKECENLIVQTDSKTKNNIEGIIDSLNKWKNNLPRQ